MLSKALFGMLPFQVKWNMLHFYNPGQGDGPLTLTCLCKQNLINMAIAMNSVCHYMPALSWALKKMGLPLVRAVFSRHSEQDVVHQPV